MTDEELLERCECRKRELNSALAQVRTLPRQARDDVQTPTCDAVSALLRRVTQLFQRFSSEKSEPASKIRTNRLHVVFRELEQALIEASHYLVWAPIAAQVHYLDFEQELWSQLNRLRNKRIATERIYIELGNVPARDLTRRHDVITFSLGQANQYFVSARTAHMSVRPLLLLYGTVSLCRTLLAVRYSNFLLDKSNRSHGMAIVDQDVTALRDVTVEVSNTGLHKLVALVLDSSPLPSGPLPATDVLSLISEVREEFRAAFAKPSRCLRTYDAEEVLSFSQRSVGCCSRAYSLSELETCNLYFPRDLFGRIRPETLTSQVYERYGR